MKTVLLVFSFLFAAVSLMNGADTNALNRLEHWYWYGGEFELLSFSASDREQIMAKLRSDAVAPGDLTFRRGAKRLLVRLGDEETIDQLLADLRARGKNWRMYEEAVEALSRSRQPLVIPKIIQDLQGEFGLFYETPTNGPRTLVAQAMAAGIIQSILMTAPDFSPAVRESVRQRLTPSYHRQQAMLLLWWEQNQEHFGKGDYAAVQPLPAVAESSALAAPAPATSPPASPAPVAGQPVTATDTSAPAAERGGRRWPWALGLVLVLAVTAGLWLWRRAQS